MKYSDILEMFRKDEKEDIHIVIEKQYAFP